jgi:hypothetical protein
MKRRLLTTVFAAALVASACASGSDTAAPASEPVNVSSQATASESESSAAGPVDDGVEDSSQTAADDADAPIERTDDEETVNETYVSPVNEALGFNPADQQAAQAEFTANAEALVRECMADAGFDYVPNILSMAPSQARLLDLNESISPDQFLAEYGYGQTTLLELNFREEGVMTFVELVIGPAADDVRSPGEQQAYELALSGRSIVGLSAEEIQEQTAGSAFTSEEGSCRNYGYTTAENPIGDKFDGLFELLGDEFEAIADQVDNDPRVREANAEWQTCMAGLGYAYENPQDAFDEFQDIANGLADRFATTPEALAIFAQAIEANLVSMNTDERFAFLEQAGAFQGFSMSPSLQAELDEAIERELVVAQHDAECYDDELILDVVFEYEQAFVEQHAEQLALIASGDA